MTLTDRKLVELAQKLSSLDAEFTHWLDESESGATFEKNHTQIRAVVKSLTQLRAKITERLQEVIDAPERALGSGQGIERMVLATHRIWEYFRPKFAQRREVRLTRYLAAANELAWACYSPAQQHAPSDVVAGYRRVPPLLFCNGGISPFSLARDHAFAAEDVPNETLSGAELRRVLDRLPISIVGVPWFQVEHLPDAVVIGHEVGHAVEEDFGLAMPLAAAWETAAGGVDAARRPGWIAWRAELFADFYGLLCLGPAYVGALMDFLASQRVDVESERRSAPQWGLYPTRSLRIAFNFVALKQLGFEAAARAMEELWRNDYPRHSMISFVPDVDELVGSLVAVTVSIGGGAPVTLPHIVHFSQDNHRRAAELARQLLRREQLTDERDPRVLFVAARLAYEEDPHAYYSHCRRAGCEDLKCTHPERWPRCPDQLLNQMDRVIAPGERGASVEEESAYAHAGDDIFALLSRPGNDDIITTSV
jgi:hypothetical protein